MDGSVKMTLEEVHKVLASCIAVGDAYGELFYLDWLNPPTGEPYNILLTYWPDKHGERSRYFFYETDNRTVEYHDHALWLVNSAGDVIPIYPLGYLDIATVLRPKPSEIQHDPRRDRA